MGNKTLESAEVFGHGGAHGVYAMDNTAESVGLQGLLNQQDAALKSGNFPLPPDVMQKINDGLAKTEKFAQQTEKIIRGGYAGSCFDGLGPFTAQLPLPLAVGRRTGWRRCRRTAREGLGGA